MNVFDRVYEQLDALPKEERIQLLRQILPPQELFSRTDGTKFIIRKHGLRIFETSTLLTKAGIPEDDPRSEVFRELRGGLVDRKIPDALRAIAARSETVCRRNGAIQLWDGGRKAWWIPLAATSQFEEAINDLIQEFERMRDNLLLDDYESVRAEAEKIEKILIDVREAERERLQAEADAAREQIRLIDLDRQLRQAELARIEQERQTRARILRDALNPEIEQAKEIIVQAQASLMRVACEIFRVIESGGEISPATMRSWNKRLEALSVLAIGNVSLEQALSDLKQLKEEIKGETFPDKRKLRAANKKVEKAFQDLERRAALEIHADQIWQLMRAGQGSEALERIAKLRQEATNSLNEVEALWKLVASVAAENEILSEEVDIADALVTQEVFE